MRGAQVKRSSGRIARPMPAAAQGQNSVLTDMAKRPKQSNTLNGKRFALKVQKAVPPRELQRDVWNQYSAHASQLCDDRRSKPSRHLPNFRNKASEVPHLLNDRQKPVWTGWKSAVMDAGVTMTPEAVSTSVHGQRAFVRPEYHLDVAMCTKLCEDGLILDAVENLDHLAHRGCYIPNNLFYRLLKWCIQDKNLVLGRRIHALTVKSGYEGDTFLATHLIGLYASHGRLKEGMEVFTKVATPTPYNWATIIFAYARHGEAAEAAQAIRLYRQMRKSNVEPDDHLYSAIVKACASAKDLVAGKEVHAHILASSRKPDKYVQAGLVDMYAKCSSLEDARRMFDKLSYKNVVTWTAMIAGYAQHGMGKETLSIYRDMQQEGLTPPNLVTFACLLQACSSVGLAALHEGKQLHADIKQRGLQALLVLGGSLVNMYAKCGSLDDAWTVFNELPEKNLVAWNAIIAGYAQRNMGQEALLLYKSMQQNGLSPNCFTFASLLQACASVGVQALSEGKQLHSLIKEQELENVLSGSLINMLAKCGNLEEARSVFGRHSERNLVAWNAMIAGYAQLGMNEKAISFYKSMKQGGLISPDSVTYVCLLQSCASVGALDEGKRLHTDIIEQGLQEDVGLGGSLVNMYAKCGNLEEARILFNKLQTRNVLTWTAMISGYCQHGMRQEALSLFRSMQQEGLTADRVTYVCLLQACASVGVEGLDEGKQLHAQIRERELQEDMVLGGSLVNMYAKCGSLDDARRVFDKLSEKNIVAWTAMIAGYSQQRMGEEALSIYGCMQQEGISPNSVTYVCLLQACARVGVKALSDGKQLHAKIEEQELAEDVVIGSNLVNMYAKCGNLEEAQSVFGKLRNRDVVTWTAMIAGYVEQGRSQEALNLYRDMRQEGLASPNVVTYVCLLQACASIGVGSLDVGKQLHVEIRERGVGVQEDALICSSLVNMYAKCGSLTEARIMFDKLSSKDIITWTAMIAGYVQQGMGDEALSLYRRMQQQPLSPDSVTYVCLLQACACVAALPLGEQLHAEIVNRGIPVDGSVGVALLNMYAKCGNMETARKVFDSLLQKSVEAWGALVSGYAHQGDGGVVFDLIDRMTLAGIHLDEIIFLSVLTVCSHAGLVDKGREYFTAMSTSQGIRATMEHFVCMVDLLGRAGHLEEALHMVQTMPFPPNDVVWHTLLAACWKWKNVIIGRQAFNGAISADEKDAASYVLMSNIYASTKMWEAADEIQEWRKEIGAWKEPGRSWWTDMDGVVHTFVVGDTKHPESESIYARLERLIRKMKKEGYVPDLESSLLDLRTDKKEAELCGHSEKLAIAYALNRTGEGTTLRIMKNLRACEDCHTAMAYISKVEKRTIICRDPRRFHVFKEGKCSCGDYW